MTDNFFHRIPAFHRFVEATEVRHYRSAPHDWYIVITDVVGSTIAIQNGKYKEVNMVAAACITASVNAATDIALPYVFGGDGATLLVPPNTIDAVKKALLGVKHLALQAHQLSLRVGIIPMQEIHARGKDILVARYEMPTGCMLAMFSGGGVAVAETMVKHEGFEIHEAPREQANLEGLSCRWQPIKPTRDTILTLLALSTDGTTELYRTITQTIEGMLHGNALTSPVQEATLKYRWPSIGLLKQSAMVWRQSRAWANMLNYAATTLLLYIMHPLNLRLGKLDMVKYRREMIANSDFCKFDDTLRMVLDCSTSEADTITAYLESLHQQGLIVYGTHRSDSALMTCFVTSLEAAGHVHFIDGNDGGYAMAAKQLKAQLLKNKNGAS